MATHIKKQYDKLNTMEDMNKFVKTIPGTELLRYIDALVVVQQNFGLDMRQEMLLVKMNSRVKEIVRGDSE